MNQKNKSTIKKYSNFFNIIFLLSLVILPANIKMYAQNELDVIRNSWIEHSDAPNSLYHYITGQAYDLLRKRADAVSAINSLTAWQERQKYIKETLLKIVGPFPEKSPLNAKILRTVEKDGYRIEHIVFESQPGFYVTSSMFIPAGLKRRSTAPAVIYVSGHSDTGYRSSVYLNICANLVMKGFIVFAFDPVGQGERL